MNEVSVILVAYKTRELILRCLSRLPPEYPTIVVDNASGDGTAEAIKSAFPHVDVIESPENVGFGRAVNLAAAHASTPYLLLLNPDTELVGDPVAALLTVAHANPSAGIYAGRTLRVDGTDDGTSCFALPSLWGYVCFATGLSSLFRTSRLFNPEQLPAFDRSTGGEVPAVSGCLMLIERDLFTQLRGFDPRYFMYSEDVDLCDRATQLGYQPVLVPDATVIHSGGASSTVTNKKVMVLLGKITYVRSRWLASRAQQATALIAIGVRLRALSSRSWHDVWRRRHEWRNGWPLPAEASAYPERPRYETHCEARNTYRTGGGDIGTQRAADRTERIRRRR